MRLPFGESDYRFAQIIWQHEPISSGDLVKRANQVLGWKKSTTYTVLKKLCDRGIFQNKNAIVTSLISQEEAELAETTSFLDKVFQGSLPSLINALTSHQKLSRQEVDQLRQFIDEYKEPDDDRNLDPTT